MPKIDRPQPGPPCPSCHEPLRQSSSVEPVRWGGEDARMTTIWLCDTVGCSRFGLVVLDADA